MKDNLRLLAGFLGVLVLLVGAFTYHALTRLEDEHLALESAPAVGHWIKTEWPSARGKHEIASLSEGVADYRIWIDEHVAACSYAQGLLPPK